MTTPIVATVAEIYRGRLVRAHRAPLPPPTEDNEGVYDVLSSLDSDTRAYVKSRADTNRPVPSEYLWVYWSDGDYQNHKDLSDNAGFPPIQEIEYPNLSLMLEHIRNISWM